MVNLPFPSLWHLNQVSHEMLKATSPLGSAGNLGCHPKNCQPLILSSPALPAPCVVIHHHQHCWHLALSSVSIGIASHVTGTCHHFWQLLLLLWLCLYSMFDEELEWEHQQLSDQIWSQTSFELNQGGFSNNAWPQWASQMIQSVWLPSHIDIAAAHTTQMAALLSNDNCWEMFRLNSIQAEEAKEMREQIERFLLSLPSL